MAAYAIGPKYVIIQEESFERARSAIREARAKHPRKLVGFTSANDELNRKIMEKEHIDLLLLLQFFRKDYAKQRNSGLNQVMARIAKERGIMIGASLDEIRSAQGKARAEILARIMQNIVLCTKAKIRMVLFGSGSKADLLGFGLSLGMPTWMPYFFE